MNKEWLIPNIGKDHVELETMLTYRDQSGNERWTVYSPMRLNGCPLSVAQCREVVDTYNAVRWEGLKVSENDAAMRLLEMKRDRDYAQRLCARAEYVLRLHNDSETVIGRIKNALADVTFAVSAAIFHGEKYPEGAWTCEFERERVENVVRAIWEPDGNHTPGFENETDEFLDAIGLPKRERASLIRCRKDSAGLVCKHCGLVGSDRERMKNGGLKYRYTSFYIHPNGDTVCSECQDRLECGLGPYKRKEGEVIR